MVAAIFPGCGGDSAECDGLGVGFGLCLYEGIGQTDQPGVRAGVREERVAAGAAARDDGTIFLPIAEDTPATGQNERLLPFAGKRVTVNGRIFTRTGSNGLVIDKIEAAK